MKLKKRGSTLDVGVLLGDPRLPYDFTEEGVLGEEEAKAVSLLEEGLASIEGYRFTYFTDHETLIDDLRSARLDLVLNFCDTGYRNNTMLVGPVAALLDILDLPYTGSNMTAMEVAANKTLTRALAMNLGISVPNETFIDLTASPLTRPRVYPALIKPNAAGGSFGVTSDSLVYNAAEAEKYLHWLADELKLTQAVSQDFLSGPEYTMGLIGNVESGFTILPPATVDYSSLDEDLSPVFTYSAKYKPDSRYWQQLRHVPAELDEVSRAEMFHSCEQLFRRLGFRDYARFDFRAGPDGKPRLLDANPNCGWHWDGRFAMMAGWAGHAYHDLLRTILETAATRYRLGGRG